jgi:hypothetical protein
MITPAPALEVARIGAEMVIRIHSPDTTVAGRRTVQSRRVPKSRPLSVLLADGLSLLRSIWLSRVMVRRELGIAGVAGR